MENAIAQLEEPVAPLISEYKQLLSNTPELTEKQLNRLNALKMEIQEKLRERYKSVTAWERVCLARHPERPQTLDFINYLTQGNFLELHGDRLFGDDPAVIAGFGKLDKHQVCIVGTQKGKNLKEKQFRNFGMASPEGYRKANRVFKLAEKYRLPVITLVDTPGAFPGIGAEERGQAEAIARSIYTMLSLNVPTIAVIIGEGGSGGAIALATSDIILMLENAWLSVISPEACSSILWRDSSHKEQSAEALKLTSHQLLSYGLIDDIVKEPPPGAHLFRDEVMSTTREKILYYINELKSLSSSEMLKRRHSKYASMGVFLVEKNELLHNIAQKQN
mgnify:CR=1 FL=1